jgi:hypothetical protein
MTCQDRPNPAPAKGSDRGKRASVDPKTGAVSGSGAGIGNPAGSEDYDDDIGTGSGAGRKPSGPSNAA